VSINSRHNLIVRTTQNRAIDREAATHNILIATHSVAERIEASKAARMLSRCILTDFSTYRLEFRGTFALDQKSMLSSGE
jgi:hypothetical protein